MNKIYWDQNYHDRPFSAELEVRNNFYVNANEFAAEPR